MKEYYIYEIKAKDGRCYIGQSSVCTEESLKNYFGSGLHIKAAIKKYGKEFFEKTILWKGVCEKSEIDDREKETIKKYKENGIILFNIADGGQGGDLGEVSRKKIGEKLSGDKNPACKPEVREKISKANKGREPKNKGTHISEELRKKISKTTKEAMKKVNMCEVARKIDRTKPSIIEGHKKQSESLKKTYENNPELKEKLSKKLAEYNKTHTPKGKKWFTNGEKCVFTYECPEGFFPGRKLRK